MRIHELHPVDERSVIIVGVPATRQLAAALPIPALSGCASALWTATPLGVPFLAHQPRTCCLFAPSAPVLEPKQVWHMTRGVRPTACLREGP
jgi:hypothetical protein